MVHAMASASLRKAAVFLASLPDQQAVGLLAKLSPDGAAALSAEMTALGTVDNEEQEAAIRDFVVSASPPPSEPPAEQLSPFAFLNGVKANDLLAAIGSEQPQTIALVLSQLPAEQAADMIALLSPEQQASIVARIARIDQPSREIIAEVAEAVRCRIVGPVRVPIARGMARLVKMFGSMRPATERKLLSGIAQADPELLRAIRCAMFGPDVAACGEWNFTAAAS
jgi:flagellar motor switch protein FliG